MPLGLTEVGGTRGQGMTHHGNSSLPDASQARPSPGALVCGCLHVACVFEPDLKLTPRPQEGLSYTQQSLPATHLVSDLWWASLDILRKFNIF